MLLEGLRVGIVDFAYCTMSAWCDEDEGCERYSIDGRELPHYRSIGAEQA
jgi:hypothetical protein